MAFYEQHYKIGVPLRVLAVIGAVILFGSAVALFISVGKDSWFLVVVGITLSFFCARAAYRGYTTTTRDDGND